MASVAVSLVDFPALRGGFEMKLIRFGEMGREKPGALVGPNDPLVIPKNATKVDWEVELAVVMEKKASYVSRENAMDFVAGFALHNDYSERCFQLERGGQWVKGKSADSFAPLGPFLATKDEIRDFNQLGMWLKVNGEFRQRGATSKMIC